MYMGKSKKNRTKDKRSSAYYDDTVSKKSKNGNKKGNSHQSGGYERQFTDWDSL